MGLGIILFDDKSVSTGVAIYAEVCHPFDDLEQLQRFDEAVWWTNLNDIKLRPVKAAHKSLHLRADHYIRPGMAKIIDHWGLGGLDPERLGLTLGAIMAPIIALDDLLPDLHTSLTMPSKLAELYEAPKFHEGAFSQALSNAFLEWTDVYAASSARLRSFSARMNCASHLAPFLSMKVPSDHGWTHFPPEALAPDQQARRNMLLSTDKPFLARVRISDHDGLIGRMLGFNSATPRSFITDLEFRYLSETHEIDVIEVFMGSEYVAFFDPVPASLRCPEAEKSYLAGMLAEQFFTAASARENLYSSTSRSFLRASVRGVWMRAAERLCMIQSCAKLDPNLITVEGVGIGYLKLGVSTPRDAYGAILSSGLLPSMSFMGDYPVPSATLDADIPISLNGLWPRCALPERLKAIIILNYLPWLTQDGKAIITNEAAALVHRSAA